MKTQTATAKQSRNASNKPAHIAPGKVYALSDVAAFIAADKADRKAQAAADKAHASASTAAGAMLAALPADCPASVVAASLNACPELLAHIVSQCKAKALYQKKPDADGKPVIAAGRWLANSGLKDALKARGFSLGMATVEGAPLFRLPDANKAKGGKAKAGNKAKAKAKAAPAPAPEASTAAPAPVVSAEEHASALACLPLSEAVALFCRAMQGAGHNSADVLAAVASADGWQVVEETEERAPVAAAA